MNLVQILLPLNDNKGKPLPRGHYRVIKTELANRFKGLTVYGRAPAEGIWKPGKSTKIDEIVVYEVMVPRINRQWWRQYRSKLERLFRQQSIVIRTQEVTVL
ncbi:MAG TPA: hypothetical protein VFE51_15225 [Verrucomicrobiae bacterium]|nr:hypothetical protein [Verrucomicrobiae bacterium]